MITSTARRRGLPAALAAALIMTLSLGVGAQAATDEQRPNSGEPADLSFGYFASDTPDLLRDRILETNSVEEVERAIEGEDLPIGVDGAEGLTVQDLFAAGVEPPMSIMSLSSAEVVGKKTANGRAWQTNDRYTWSTCSSSCKDEWWVNWTITFDPGKTGSRNTVNFTRFGTGAPSKVTLRSNLHINGTSRSNVSNAWTLPDNGVQWNSPHVSAAGKQVQTLYQLTIPRPGGTQKATWKTGESTVCKDATATRAFSCTFL